MHNKSECPLTSSANLKIYPIRELCWQWLDDFIRENIEVEIKNLSNKRLVFENFYDSGKQTYGTGGFNTQSSDEVGNFIAPVVFLSAAYRAVEAVFNCQVNRYTQNQLNMSPANSWRLFFARLFCGLNRANRLTEISQQLLFRCVFRQNSITQIRGVFFQ